MRGIPSRGGAAQPDAVDHQPSVRARCRADTWRTRRQAVPQGAAQVLSMATTMRWVRLRAKGIARKAVLAAIGQPMAGADHDRIKKSFRQPILKNVNAPAHDK